MNKANQRLRYLLGITQEELAMLLGISRSQLSLYELGLRELPTAALQKLAEMISVLQNADVSKLRKSRTAGEGKKHQADLTKQLTENNFKQQLLVHKINSLTEKHDGDLKKLHLFQHLIGKGEHKESHQHSLLGVLERRTDRALEKNSDSKVVQYQIKLKVLQEEEKLLREEIEGK